MSLFSNNLLLGAGGQSTGPAPFDPTVIGNSVWLDGSADTLTKTFGSGSAQTKIVISTWVLRNSFTSGASQDIFCAQGGTGGATRQNRIFFQTDDTIDISLETTTLKTIIYSTTKVFRDIGWYHILLSVDQGAALGPSQANLFVNGVPVPIAATVLDQGFSAALSSWGNTALHSVGSNNGNALLFKGYQAQTTMLVGQSIQSGDVAVTDFLDSFAYGTNGSQFAAKKDSEVAALASTAGGNSFCLDYGNSGSLGLDISSLGNNFTPVSMAAANQSTNTPSLVYPTMNPLNDIATVVLSEGNTRVNAQASASIRSTAFAADGKRYAEITVTAIGNSYLGVAVNGTNPTSFAATGAVACQQGGDIYVSSSSPSGNKCPAYTTGDVMGILIDVDADKFWVSKNGTFHSMDRNPTITLTATQVLAGTGGFDLTALGSDGSYGIHVGNSDGTAANVSVNFGQASFSHTPPDGYVDWASDNFDAPEFQGKDFFDATLYEGNGTGQRVGDFVPFTDLYTVDNSIIFDVVAQNNLQRTMSAAASDSNKKFTVSAWVKRIDPDQTFSLVLLESTDGGGGNGSGIRIASSTSQKQLHLYAQGSGNSGGSVNVYTNTTMASQTSSWSHFLVQVDTTLATATDRVKMYIDGVLQSVDNSAGGAADFPTQDSTFVLGTNTFSTHIGRIPYGAAFLNSMYLAEHAFITGTNSTSKSVSDYGSLDTATNRWIPKDISGFTFGHNGSYLEFQTTPGSGSGAGTDTSGNSNNWTEAIGSSASAWTSLTNFKMIDTPSQNYATLDSGRAGSGIVLAQGNLKQTAVTDSNVMSTMPIPTSGKWAFTANIDALDFSFGVASEQNSLTSKVGSTITSWGINDSSRPIFEALHNNVGVFDTTRPSVSDKLIAAIDMDLGHLWLGFDTGSGFTFFGGGNPATGATPTYTSVFVSGQRLYFASGRQLSVSFGGQSATLNGALPTGFLELNQDNLDDTASKLTALAWIKNRDATDNHMLANRVRGPQFINNSNSNSTGETTNPNAIQRFLQRGVQVGNDVAVNTENESFVLWQWLMGDSATTGSTTSPAGSIASTTIVSDANHMSIGTFTGTGSNGTVGHGLSAAPEAFVVFNPTADARFKMFFHKDSNASPASGYIHLESNEGFQTDATIYNNTLPTSTVFSVGTNGSINENTKLNTFITWRSIPGVCKVGSYTGNGNNDGPYISVGFLPRYILVKSTSATRNWNILDTVRNPVNIASPFVLLPNSTAVDTAGQVGAFDILADGFKPRDSALNTNGSGETYLYMVMADIGGNGTLPPIYGQ